MTGEALPPSEYENRPTKISERRANPRFGQRNWLGSLLTQGSSPKVNRTARETV
jgi:hypothetical protein